MSAMGIIAATSHLFFIIHQNSGDSICVKTLSPDHELSLIEGAQVSQRWRFDFEQHEALPEQLGRKGRSVFWAMANKQTGISQIARLVINEGLHAGSASAFQQVQVAKTAFKLDARPGSCKRKVLLSTNPN